MPVCCEPIPVTVIIPCFNCQDTISRAVESVVRQTAQPIEIILVDDCNAGATLNLLNILANQHTKGWIKVISLAQNGGPGSARNAGWEVAQGSYIAFLDADDTWHPNKLELQYRWMCARPDVILTGHGTNRLPKAGVASYVKPETINGRRVSRRDLLISNQFPTRSVMLQKNIPFRFLPEKRYSEDYLLWLQIVLAGYPAQYLDAVLAFSYKPDFGSAGLSENLWEHEKGELATYKQIYQDRLISLPMYCVASAVSVFKFFRRMALTIFGRTACA